ncbi:MAG: DeoR/GlpR family DNA-binding transcription regulator [Actinobacteria bacterium]|nr:DeoR/GlpR family DNA-binding transcription regulator [Actinomycetota bacterium]
MDVPEKRRLEIKKIITKNNSISVISLAKLFNVSEITVRRDLQKLEKDGFLDKVHGGAIARCIKTEYDPVYLEDIKLNKDKKEKIAKEAVKEINDGDAVIIESGTTCLELVYNLTNKRNLAVFTASVPLAYELWKVSLNRNDLEVNICGGLIEAKSNTLIGSQAVQFFQNINADVAFIGAVAISIDKGILTTHSQMDADVIRSIANNSKRKILLADSSKFKKRAHISILPLTIFNKIITDKGIDKEVADKIINLGIDLEMV